MSSKIYNFTEYNSDNLYGSNSAQNNSNSYNIINNFNCKKINKGLLSSFEQMKQQLDLRKEFISKMGVCDEKEIFSGDNFQEQMSFFNTVSTNIFKKQLENNQDRIYENSSQSITYLDSPQIKEQSQINKKQTNSYEYNDGELPQDSYKSIYSLQQDQIIAPYSSGESSPNSSDEETDMESNKNLKQLSYNLKMKQNTSLEDVLMYLIDSTLLQMEKEPQVQRANKADKSTQWQNCNELLFSNINVHLSFSELKKEMKERFKTFHFIQFDKLRSLYYKGKYSLLVTFGEENNAQFVYFNYNKNQQQYRNIFGENLEVYKVNQNNLNLYCTKSKIQNSYNQISQRQASSNKESSSHKYWVPVIVRNLPINFEHANLNHFLQNINVFKTVQNIEDFIILNEKKHTMIVFSNLESAIHTLLQIPTKFKDISYIRANLHPKYQKLSWTNKNLKENPYYAFYDISKDDLYQNTNQIKDYDQSTEIQLQLQQAKQYIFSSKTCQFFQFQRSFLEDLILIKNIQKQKKGNMKENDQKKLLQRSISLIDQSETMNIEVENQEKYFSQKSSKQQNETPFTQRDEENSYQDYPPPIESYHRRFKTKKYKRDYSSSLKKYKNNKKKYYDNDLQQSKSKSSLSSKEDRYETPTNKTKYTPKQKISNFQQSLVSPQLKEQEDYNYHHSNLAPVKNHKSQSRTTTQESSSEKKSNKSNYLQNENIKMKIIKFIIKINLSR